MSSQRAWRISSHGLDRNRVTGRQLASIAHQRTFLPGDWKTPSRKGGPGRMTHFLGTHQNRLDAKGRVSIPAPFRAALKSRGDTNGNGTHLVLRPSHQHQCIEAWPAELFDALSEQLSRLNLFSPQHDDLAASLFADAFPVEADKEGRVVLPDSLVSYAGLTDAV